VILAKEGLARTSFPVCASLVCRKSPPVAAVGAIQLKERVDSLDLLATAR
jgi:hypothetical protein